MRPLKDAGLSEVRSLKRRVGRLLALDRVLPSDARYILKRLDEIEARIVTMMEFNEYGEEEN